MQISFNASRLRDWPLDTLLALVSEAGYETVELNWSQIENEFPNADQDISQVLSLLKAKQLNISGLDIGNIEACRIEDLNETINVLSKRIMFADQLGMSCVIAGGGVRKKQSLEILVQGIRAMLSIAEESNITIFWANRYHSRIEQLEDLRYIYLELNHPEFQVLNDTGQFHLASVNPRDALREFGDYTGAILLADMIGTEPVSLGQGEVNIPAVIEHARRIGFQGRWVVNDMSLTTIETQRQLADARIYLQSLLLA